MTLSTGEAAGGPIVNKLNAILLFVGSLLTVGLRGQVPEPPQNSAGQPIFRVTVVERTTNAVSYRHRTGWPKADPRGTPLGRAAPPAAPPPLCRRPHSSWPRSRTSPSASRGTWW